MKSREKKKALYLQRVFRGFPGSGRPDPDKNACFAGIEELFRNKPDDQAVFEPVPKKRKGE